VLRRVRSARRRIRARARDSSDASRRRDRNGIRSVRTDVLRAVQRRRVSLFPVLMTQRRFVAAAACGFAMFFAVDWWLYSDLGFLRMFGQGTQEGQIVSKVARARRMAEAADVIAFGSSY